MDSGLGSLNSSRLTFNESLNVFQPRLIDPSVDEVSLSETKPQTAIDQQGPYVFEIPPCQDPIDLQNILLSVECKIAKADNSAIGLQDQVGPVNNVLHTLFSQVEVKLGDTVVSYNHSLYPYQSYLEELLYGDSSETDGRLRMQGFIIDKAGAGAIADPEANPTNDGLKSRRNNIFGAGRTALLIGRLHCDIFRQDKYLVEKVPIRVTLQRSPDEFCLLKAGGTTFKIVISDMSLMIPRVKVSEAMRRSVESRLESGLVAQYNINRTVMMTHMIPSGALNFNIPTLFRGRLPHTVVLAMSRSENRKPDVDKNPFVFEEYNLKQIVLSRNNVAVGYHSGLSVNYSAGFNHTAGYLNLLRNTGKMGGGSLISHEAFRAGFNVFPFKVVPQENNHTDTSALNEGVLTLDLTFSAVNQFNIDLFVLAMYNGVISVDKHRVVKIETGS